MNIVAFTGILFHSAWMVLCTHPKSVFCVAIATLWFFSHDNAPMWVENDWTWLYEKMEPLLMNVAWNALKAYTYVDHHYIKGVRARVQPIVNVYRKVFPRRIESTDIMFIFMENNTLEGSVSPVKELSVPWGLFVHIPSDRRNKLADTINQVLAGKLKVIAVHCHLYNSSDPDPLAFTECILSGTAVMPVLARFLAMTTSTDNNDDNKQINRKNASEVTLGELFDAQFEPIKSPQPSFLSFTVVDKHIPQQTTTPPAYFYTSQVFSILHMPLVCINNALDMHLMWYIHTVLALHSSMTNPTKNATNKSCWTDLTQYRFDSNIHYTVDMIDSNIKVTSVDMTTHSILFDENGKIRVCPVALCHSVPVQVETEKTEEVGLSNIVIADT